MKRSTSWLVCSVIAAHGFAICMVLLIQGCGTPITPRSGTTTQKAPVDARSSMPPRPVAQRPVVQAPQIKRTHVPPVQVPVRDSKTYVVQKGDTLSQIAKRFNVTTTELMAMNQIKKADVIHVGQRLSLPGHVDLSAPKPAAAKPKATSPVAAGSGVKYVVKPGDTLSQIALDHGVKTDDIRGANTITKDIIFVGQSLMIPGATKKPAALAATVASSDDPPEKKASPTLTEPSTPAPVDGPAVDGNAANVQGTPDEDADTGASTLSTGGVPLTMHTHEVNEGEDLYSVSLIWDVSIDELKRINGLSGTDLKVGQVLRIPRAE